MKKIIFLMLIATLCCQQAGAQNFTFGGLKYTVTSPTTVEVAFQNYVVIGSVVIPPQVTYNGGTYSVNSIAIFAFDGCNGITSVTIPNSVTSIGARAFYYCAALTSISIPNSVTSMGNRVFAECVNLNSVILPNSITSIGIETFSVCSSLTSIDLPNSIITIGDSAFQGSGLNSLTIPNSVTNIGNSAFSGCIYLTSVTIPNSVTSIGEYAFSSCIGLTSVTIPNSLNSIAARSFHSCSGLTSVTIPNSVTNIGYGAFSYCSGLTSVSIPNSITSIDGYAFQNCTGLASVAVDWSTPLAINNTVFDGVNTPTVVLNVPNGTAAFYDATAVWTDFIINEALSVTPFSATNAFDLIAYPNPSNNVFNFKMNGANEETVSILVFDMTGRQIENKVVHGNDFKNITLGQNYASGVYNVVASQGRNTKTVRLVKE